MTPDEAHAHIEAHLAHRRALEASRRALLPAIRTRGRAACGTVTAFVDRLAEATDRPPYTVKNRLYDRPDGPVADDALRLLGYDVPADGPSDGAAETPAEGEPA